MTTTLALPRKLAAIVICYTCNQATVPQQGPAAAASFSWQSLTSQRNDLGPKSSQGHQSGTGYCPGLMSVQELQLEIGLERKLPATQAQCASRKTSLRLRARLKGGSCGQKVWWVSQVSLVGAIQASLCSRGPDRHNREAGTTGTSYANFLDLTASGLCRKSEGDFSVSLKSLPILWYLYAENKQALF